ncbi:serine/threonine-protein kinase [Marinobacter sp. SS21]|uniref:serine/threonine-protein kinase n=1 Tax=Marinobacter sp. SS21 TaxID=2979460 RepID=UPI00232E51B1|nr:serine/threonine-protein kinase [Marinobacter sp. SS21]MDC0663160.1 serine/threonine protein kinase [Marinobacter sp. SS21]
MTQPLTLALGNGTRIAEYRIERLLGEGGFGLTYLALDENLHKLVAIKEYLPVDIAMRGCNAQVIPRTESTRNDFNWGLEAFINEARTLAKFHNPYIVQVFRYFEANGTAYIVMEYVEGRTLRETVQALGQLRQDEIMAILLPVLDGLMDVHGAGILHRDIKPENILIRDNGNPVLIDFGAARQALGGKSRPITAIITPGYVPIEQYSTRGNVGPWSDIYSLAAVAYFCLTRKRPEDASDRVIHDDLLPAREVASAQALPAFLEAIDHGLAVSPQDRPQTLESWVRALRGDTEPAMPPTPADAATVRVPPTPKPEPEPTPSPAASVPPAAAAVERSSHRRTLVILLALLLIALSGLVAQRWLATWEPTDDASTGQGATGGDATDVSDRPGESNHPGDTEVAAAEPAEPEPEPEPEPATTFALTIHTDPEQARIILLADPRRYSPGMELEAGRYRFRISLPGYRTVEITVESGGDDVVKRVNLEHDITAEEQALFDRAKSSQAVADLEAYLASYPLGSYAERVRDWLEAAREREQQVAEEQAQQRPKLALRAFRACETMPWKASVRNGRAVFSLPQASRGDVGIRVGGNTVRSSQIAAIDQSSPLYELCRSPSCYEVTAPFGLADFSISRGRQESTGEACFYYPDERSHDYTIEF